MANPWRGEVELVVDGEPRVMRLTLGALAELEARLKSELLIELIARFEAGGFRVSDLIALLTAGLNGGGWRISEAELVQAPDRRRAAGGGAGGGAAPEDHLHAARRGRGGMTRIAWPGLMRLGLVQLGLTPEVFWSLTPAELMLMAGMGRARAALTRAGLDELAARFPDSAAAARNWSDHGGFRSGPRPARGAVRGARGHGRPGSRA